MNTKSICANCEEEIEDVRYAYFSTDGLPNCNKVCQRNRNLKLENKSDRVSSIGVSANAIERADLMG